MLPTGDVGDLSGILSSWTLLICAFPLRVDLPCFSLYNPSGGAEWGTNMPSDRLWLERQAKGRFYDILKEELT